MTRREWPDLITDTSRPLLAKKQRGHIHPDHTGYAGNSSPEDAIQGKAADIPMWYQKHHHDLALLKLGGFLDDVPWSSVTDGVTSVAANTYRSNTTLSSHEMNNAAFQFGFDVGSTIDLLIEDEWKDVLRGIIVGLIGRETDPSVDGKQPLNEISDMLGELAQYQYLAEMEEQQIERFLDMHTPDEDRIAPRLQGHGLEPVDPLMQELNDRRWGSWTDDEKD